MYLIEFHSTEKPKKGLNEELCFIEYFKPTYHKLCEKNGVFIILFKADYDVNELKNNTFDFSIFFKVVHCMPIDHCSAYILNKKDTNSDFFQMGTQYLNYEKTKIEFADDHYWTKG